MLVCPLDCWDMCVMKKEGDKFIPTNEGITNNFLCPKLNNYFKYPKYNPEFNLNEVEKLFKSTKPNRILFLKGSGNTGIMQNITKLFFEKLGATFVVGSSCDGLGEKGIINAGLKAQIISTNKIKKAKNIVFWGRNSYETNTHLIPLIKNTKKLCIDVRLTKTARNSDVFYQINPNSDIFLAKYLVTKKKKYLEKTGLKEVNELEKILNEGAIIFLGLGVSKAKWGDKTIQTIFALQNEKINIAYLGSSMEDLNNPFDVKPKNTMPLFEIEWNEIDVVFIQGSNPLKSLPNFKIPKDKKVIVFGKFLDETAKKADVFIPTKDFYAKKDIKSSYFHEFVFKNEAVEEDFGISEYEFTKEMFKRFNFGGLKSEDEYIDEIYKSKRKIKKELKTAKFIDEKIEYLDGMWLVTAKNRNSLNSQFKTDNFAYAKNLEGKYILETKVGKIEVEIKKDESLHPNVIFMYAGSEVNKIISSSGEFATYAEIVKAYK
jgi:anaerobic selenocysteine-containing dehydrogenase